MDVSVNLLLSWEIIFICWSGCCPKPALRMAICDSGSWWRCFNVALQLCDWRHP